MDDQMVATDFRTELSALLNRFTREKGSDTPDFILAQFVVSALVAFDGAVVVRDRWLGRSIAEPVGPEPDL
jgi:acid phosphatase family membrane protein YuiD